MLEAADGVGGIWYWDRDPGVRCDSASCSSFYSVSPALEQGWEWTERYPQQREIMRCLNHVADGFAMRPDNQLGTSMTSARYVAAAERRLVETDTGEQFRACFLITAVGCLSTTSTPAFPGIASFALARYAAHGREVAQAGYRGFEFA